MSLEFAARLGARGFDARLRVESGTRVAVVGANGTGKSTLLELIAGLARPDAGAARLDGRTLFDLGPGVSEWTPPHRRRAGLLTQEPSLFPHLTVAGNVAFGPTARGAAKPEAARIAAGWLERLGAGELAGRRPRELSGGQAQRVAIARALAAEPELLLLDEPMAALDVGAAGTLRRTLRDALDGRTALIVTHDPLDALLLCDEVAVVQGGAVVERGPVERVLSQPRTDFAARLAGLNLVRGVAVEGGVRAASGARIMGVASAGVEPGARAVAVFAPSAVSLHLEEVEGSPRNRAVARVADLAPHGELVRVRCLGADGLSVAADVSLATVAELDLHEGLEVRWAVKAAAVAVHPA